MELINCCRLHHCNSLGELYQPRNGTIIGARERSGHTESGGKSQETIDQPVHDGIAVDECIQSPPGILPGVPAAIRFPTACFIVNCPSLICSRKD